MDRALFDHMAENADRHWWYVARRAVLVALIRRRIAPPPGARILEVGCGTGHNLAMLAGFGAVAGTELDDQARTFARDRLNADVAAARLPELDGVAEAAFDLVAALDVIEHVADDVGSLASLARRLRPGGRLLVTVPAYPWLWSAHDVANHHLRRYTARSLRNAADAAGLRVEHLGYFNMLLLPLVIAARIAGKVTGKDSSDDAMPSPAVNRALKAVFALERYWIGRLSMPAGVSLVAVLTPAR